MSRISKLTILGILIVASITVTILLTQKKAALPDYGITINMYGKVTNPEAQSAFVEAYQQGNSGQWQKFTYTVEGDPIIYTVRYNNQPISLEISIDTRQDKFGIQGIKTYTCQKMIASNKLRLTGCGANNDEIVIS